MGKMIAAVVIGLVIFSGIAGGAWYAFASAKDSERRSSDARTDAVQIQQLAEQYQLQKRSCPSGLSDLQDAGFKIRTMADPWGEHYDLRCDSGAIEVVSPGPDRKMGTDDDVSSNMHR